MSSQASQTQGVPRKSAVTMLGIAFIIGIIAGFGAIVFRIMIAVVHNLLFVGQFSWYYDANVHTASSAWGAGVIAVPIIGAVLVITIVKFFAPEAKGHGVPEVIDAIYYKSGKIRPQVAIFKSLASAISIGTGGSVGREGPIIQIGAAFGSAIGQWITMPVRQRITLIAAGAGAGIAATFNAPIGGIAFAIELLLVSVNAASLAIVATATVTAAYIGRAFLGLYPAFDIPVLAMPSAHMLTLYQMILFVPFGIAVGLLATVFTQGLYWAEDKFEALPINDYWRHTLGMALLGVLIYVMFRSAGHYYVDGVGYATIVDVLNGSLTDPIFLLCLCLAKLLATYLTLGSGASGGVFSPALFVGATFGAAVGQLIFMILPDAGIDPVMFPIAAMAGMIAGTTGAVLTAIIMLFEMTRDYHAILPIVFTSALAYLTRVHYSRESIYTLKLIRRGHIVHEGLQAAISSAKAAEHVMSENFAILSKHDYTLKNEAYKAAAAGALPVIITESEKVIGVYPPGCLHYSLASLERYRYIVVDQSEPLLSVLRQLRLNMAMIALVCIPGEELTLNMNISNIKGVITASEIMDASTKAAMLMSGTV